MSIKNTLKQIKRAGVIGFADGRLGLAKRELRVSFPNAERAYLEGYERGERERQRQTEKTPPEAHGPRRRP